jgi:hypothetical protein
MRKNGIQGSRLWSSSPAILQRTVWPSGRVLDPEPTSIPSRDATASRSATAAIVIPDLDQAAIRFREEFGLDSTEGGRHERWGTANRIVPLGDQYLELVASVDEQMAAETAFSRGVLEA